MSAARLAALDSGPAAGAAPVMPDGGWRRAGAPGRLQRLA